MNTSKLESVKKESVVKNEVLPYFLDLEKYVGIKPTVDTSKNIVIDNVIVFI